MQKLFVIGDSVSIHYGPFLEKNLNLDYSYDRKGLNENDFNNVLVRKGLNIGNSNSMVEYLKEKKKIGFSCDVLLLNCGLHDIKINKKSGERVCSLQNYEKNCREIISVAKDICKKVVWVTTTHFDEKRHNELNPYNDRFNADNAEYARTAEIIMKTNDVYIVNLRNFTQDLGEDLWSDHVHFKDWVIEKQGKYIASQLPSILK